MGALTPHVLDTAQGKLGSGIRVDLYAIHLEDRRLVKSVLINHDGRRDEPLLSGDAFQIGLWELVFHIGAYHAQASLCLPSTPFLDQVPVRVGMAADAHYHAPLLVFPWGYTTYRGS